MVRKKLRDSDQTTGKRFGATARATVTVRTTNIDTPVSCLRIYCQIENKLIRNSSNCVYWKQKDESEGIDALPYNDRLEVSDGSGPVDALAGALKRALVPSNPSLDYLELIDYKVRILDPESATAAATRVMIEFKDTQTEKTWTTVSVDRNVISASLNALADGFEYALIEHSEVCALYDDFFD